MTKVEVVERLPGLTRDNLYYWETRGWVKPSSSPTGGRRRYTEQQFRRSTLYAWTHQGRIPHV